MNWNGIFYDRIAGWLGIDDNPNTPQSKEEVIHWFPIWDPESGDFLGVPKGMEKVLVGFKTYRKIECEFFFWNHEKNWFYWDKKCENPVSRALVKTFVCWSMEPEPPEVW